MFSSIRVFLAALALAPASLAFAQQRPDVRLDAGSPPGAAISEVPQVASAGSSVYAAWQDHRNGDADVYFNRSLDGGATWLASDVRLDVGSAPGASASWFPRIAASDSAVYAVWSESYHIHFNRSLDGGASWLPSDRHLDTGSGATSPWMPRIAAAGTAVYAVWMEQNASSQWIQFNRSLDGGTSWLPSDVRIGLGTDPEVAAVGSAIYVTWYDGDNMEEVGDIYFNRSLDGGATWLPSSVRLSNGRPPRTAFAGQPQIAASGSGVYVTWFDHRNGGEPNVYFNRSLDGGATWLATDTRLNLGSGGAGQGFGFPALGIAASEASVYVAWQDSRFGTEEAVYFNRSLDGGTTWLDPDVRLDTGSTDGYSRYPRIAAEGYSVFVLWREERLFLGSVLEFQRSIDAGASWLAEQVRLDAGGAWGTTNVGFPEIAASGASAYAVWDDYRNGEADIYFDLALGFQAYGQGTNSSGGLVPMIAGARNPSIGGSFSVDIAGGTGGASGYLFAGTNGRAAGRIFVQSPFQAIPFQLGGSTGVPGAGSISIAFPVPPDPALIGLRVDFQARILEAPKGTGRTVRSLVLTGGLETWIL